MWRIGIVASMCVGYVRAQTEIGSKKIEKEEPKPNESVCMNWCVRARDSDRGHESEFIIERIGCCQTKLINN